MGHWVLPPVDPNVLSPPPRGGHACAAVGSQVVVFGGADRSPTPYNDLWVLNTEGGKYEWRCVMASNTAGTPVRPRTGATMTAVDDKVYVYGGQDPVSGICYDDLLMLDTASWQWSPVEVEGGKPPPRHSHCAGLFKDHCLLVFGGAGMNGLLGDVWVFNSLTRQWTHPSIQGTPLSAREMHSGTMVSPSHMVVYGGRRADGQVLSDAAVLNGDAMTWESHTQSLLARCAHAAIAAPSAREGSPEASSNRSLLSGEAAPATTTSAAASTSDPEHPASVLVYGGFSGVHVETDLLRLSVGGKRMVMVEPSSSDGGHVAVCPAARFAHTAVSVPTTQGSHNRDMIVFGGVNPAEDLGDVAVYQA
ncbi:hypothetical protein WJX72_008920 [[Myrmecia] bisecta]|uniref:Galactose oxidase n=1 Tax=[Myrmecia] bisecta TaxID=41462 RepID=A0AAW1R870_9CHLO